MARDLSSRTTPSAARESGGVDADLTFIGTATMLLRFGSIRILTDPNFIHAGEEIPLGYGLTAHRLTDPAMEIDALPPLDAVLLSHFHADHFDRIAEERLDRDLEIVTTPQAADILAGKGFTATRGLDTWHSTAVLAAPRRGLPTVDGNTTVRITAMPGRHAPALLSVALPDVMGSMLEVWPDDALTGQTEPELRLYISGDTIIYEGLREIPERYPVIDVGVLHLGGTRVMGVTVTMDADQGVQWLRMMRPARAVPVHFDDYDAFKSPLAEFTAAVEQAGLEGTVVYVDRGSTLAL